VSFEIIVLGISVSFVTAWVVIALFLRSIEQVGMTPFVLYRLVLGLALLAWYW
jgi:undecaprenyl-diphosphatase